ncbi:MAG: helix-turn-helix domain-containing protein [Rhizobium sp.]|nr:helix-turn-helix domain-containing protein [Rhizobium sp.]
MMSASPDLPHPERHDLRLTDVLFALSDPERLAIVRQLAAGPLEMAQCHLSDPTIPKSTKSHLMKVLREAGVIRNTPLGRGRRLSLRIEDLEARFPGLLTSVLQAAGEGD